MRITIEVPDDADSEAMERIKMTEAEKLNAVCFWLIKQCTDVNAETMTINQEQVHQFGKQLVLRNLSFSI